MIHNKSHYIYCVHCALCTFCYNIRTPGLATLATFCIQPAQAAWGLNTKGKTKDSFREKCSGFVKICKGFL